MLNHYAIGSAAINSGPQSVITPADPGEYVWSALGQADIDPTFSAGRDHLATVLRVLYDLDYSTGEYRRAAVLDAPDAIDEYGRIERQVEARWLRDTRAAVGLGERLLGYYARPLWVMSGSAADRHELQPGGLVSLTHGRAPVSGNWRVTNLASEPSGASQAITAEASAGPAPRVRLAQLVNLSGADAAITITGAHAADGKITITVMDGNYPLTGAAVTLDDTTTRNTDADGRAQFAGTAGEYTVAVQVPGGKIVEQAVTVG